MAWLVQSTITLWIVGGCYRRYVDKIDTTQSYYSHQFHAIGMMGCCQFVHVNSFFK